MHAPRTLGLAGAFALLALVAAASPAVAHQSPPGCTANGLEVDLEASAELTRDGDSITFTPSYSNDSPGACDVTNAPVTVWLPSADGTPQTGESEIVASIVTAPAGTPRQELPELRYTVDLDDGVFRSPATVSVSGTLHDSMSDGTATASQSTDIVVSRPRVTLSVTPTPASGFAPLTVGYRYLAANDSPLDPGGDAAQPGVAGAELIDDRCAPVTLTGGDADGDAILDRGEAWSYACSAVFGVGSFVDRAGFTGTSTLDGRPWPAASAASAVTVVAAPIAPSPPAPKDQPPRLRQLSLSPAAFRAARSGPSVAARKPPVGTKVAFSVSEASLVRFRVARRLPGRRAGTRCVKPRRSNRSRKPCTRLVAVKGSFVVAAKPGKRTFRFSGRLRGKPLPPGRYRLSAVATDAAGKRSATVRKPFRIVPASRRR